MKKKGFTLIELLAVIVVLAIIALIATPIVMNVIKNAQKGATERSAERYVDAVETAIATDRLENGLVADGIYTVDADGNLVLGDKTLTVEVSGNRPEVGSAVVINNGQVVSEGTSMIIGDYIVAINNKGNATANERVILCIAATPSTQNVPKYVSSSWTMTTPTVGEQATSANPYALGAVYSCELGDGVSRTFYVLKEYGNNVKLIMNENLGGTVAWLNNEHFLEAGGVQEDWDNKENVNVYGPITAKAALAERTSRWTKISQSQITLPDAQDIADAMGDSEWTDNHYTAIKGPDWMITNLEAATVPYGYWTSTPRSHTSSNASWYVYCNGVLDNYNVVDVYGNGVRPVVTISKANMSL